MGCCDINTCCNFSLKYMIIIGHSSARRHFTWVSSQPSGSPMTVPSGWKYPAYRINWLFHMRVSLFVSVRFLNTVIVDLVLEGRMNFLRIELELLNFIQ